jgi:hypothetical protein
MKIQKYSLIRFALITVSPFLCAASLIHLPIINQFPPLPKIEYKSNASTKVALLPKGSIPEHQLTSPNYPQIDSPIFGQVLITGGFMEPDGHSQKGELWAIFEDQPDALQLLPASQRNIGWDLVVKDATLSDSDVHPEAIRSWFSSVVTWEGFVPGYGWQLEAQLNQPFRFNGQSYTVYAAYSHGAEQFYAEPGENLEPGQVIGRMGGTGWDPKTNDYPPHSDMKLWIVLEDGRQVYVSPNLLIRQLSL